MLVGGDAGVGKTSLVGELVRQARRRTPSCSPATPSTSPTRRRSGRCSRRCARRCGPRPDDEVGALLSQWLERLPSTRGEGPPVRLLDLLHQMIIEAGRAAAGAAGDRGPALGRPVHPRPRRVPRRRSSPTSRCWWWPPSATTPPGPNPRPRGGARRAAPPPEGDGDGAASRCPRDVWPSSSRNGRRAAATSPSWRSWSGSARRATRSSPRRRCAPCSAATRAACRPPCARSC